MKTQKMYQVDAFASQVFEGNPAAVMVLDDFPADSVMQNIAMENNLSETAFVVRSGDHWLIRWFTPKAEVDFCGHATVASAHVLMAELAFDSPVHFKGQVGDLIVRCDGGKYVMDAPRADITDVTPVPAAITDIFGPRVEAVFEAGGDCFAVFPSSADVERADPDMAAIKMQGFRGVCITAPGDPNTDYDFVSRFFAPLHGIDEDPVTGSMHAALTPFWADRLGKLEMRARQLSKRGGDLDVKLNFSRVEIAGEAVTFMTADVRWPN